jgi:hypothetical protein
MSSPVSEKVTEAGAARRRLVLEVLLAFLRLGVTSFGGPGRASRLLPCGIRRAPQMAG